MEIDKQAVGNRIRQIRQGITIYFIRLKKSITKKIQTLSQGL
ncbi:hypothetical protein EfmAA818_07570 [Enterococcus faecium]|nr:hypothetical protein EfmAA818_07570 [Enterococcus faecium]